MALMFVVMMTVLKLVLMVIMLGTVLILMMLMFPTYRGLSVNYGGGY